MSELIVALDTDSAAQAKAWVDSLGDRVNFYKVGLELFTAVGPSFLGWLKQRGKSIFLDLKFHDIPSTAAGAVAAAASWGVDFCTVHASGGQGMLAACRANSGPMQLLAVTVLTSLGDEDLQLWGPNSLGSQVAALAKLAVASGCHGIVAAASDLASLKDLPAGFLRVTPGIRPLGSDRGDQKRVLTPAEAVRAGASHIVVGRPILGAPDPGLAAAKIIAELRAC